jgi:hypothetical protein
LVFGGIILVVVSTTVGHPTLLTRLFYGAALVNAMAFDGDLPMYWSERRHDRDGWRRLQLEGGTSKIEPSRIRLLADDGSTIVERETYPLEAEKTLGICDTHSLLGARWWASNLQSEVLDSVESGRTSFVLEAQVGDTWRRVRLFDTGCRILDVGRA